MKKALCILLSLIMLLSASTSAFASEMIDKSFCIDDYKQRWTRGYKRYKETSGLIEWKECQIFHSIFT